MNNYICIMIISIYYNINNVSMSTRIYHIDKFIS